MPWNKNYDRTETNADDNQTFYGYDNEDGTTDWYDKDGNLDCITKTPCDWWEKF